MFFHKFHNFPSPSAHTNKVLCLSIILNARREGKKKSLYLILKVLFPPLGSNVGRKMLREFHIAGTSVPLEAPKGVRAAVPSAVDATFVISVNLAAPLNMRRVKPGALRSLLLLLTPLLVRPGPVRALRAGAVPHTISPKHGNVLRGGFAGLTPLFF